VVNDTSDEATFILYLIYVGTFGCSSATFASTYISTLRHNPEKYGVNEHHLLIPLIIYKNMAAMRIISVKELTPFIMCLRY
jgi:hypothetical protein